MENAVKDTWIRTTCKMCIHSCGIRVHVIDGVVLKIEGDPENEDNRGKICAKGHAGIMRLYDPHRVKTPLKRTNPQKGPGVDPRWQPITWEEAYDIVGKRLRKIREEDPRKLLCAINDFHRSHLGAWRAAFGTEHRFTTVGQYCGAAYHPVNGVVDGSFAAVNDYDYCQYWIQIGGGDGFSSHLHLAGSANRMADARVQRGMKVVVVEPRMSTGAAKADEWIPILPGTDRAFVLGMCHVMLFELKQYDAQFIRHHTNGPYLIRPDGLFVRDPETCKAMVWDGVDDRAKTYDDPGIEEFALEGNYVFNGIQCRPAFQVIKDQLKDHTPERMSRICTVSADTIRRIAKEFVEAARIGSTITLDGKVYPYRPAAVNFYRGAIGHFDGTMDHVAMKLMNFLVGNIDVPGGHIGVALNLKNPKLLWVEPGEDVMIKPQAHMLHPMIPFSYPPNTFQTLEFFPLGLDPGHLVADNILHPERFGFNFKPEAMLIEHSNPMWNITGTEKVMEVFKMMDFIVGIDVILNESTEWADIVLPDHTYLESYHLFMIEPPEVVGHWLRQPVIEPLHESRDANEIFMEISERAGCLDEFNAVLSIVLCLKPEHALQPGCKYTTEELLDRHAKSIWGDDKGLEWFKKNGSNVRKLKPSEKYMVWEGMRIPIYFNLFPETALDLQEKFKAVGITNWDTSSYQPVPIWRDVHPLHRLPEEYDLYAIGFKEHLLNTSESTSIPWINEVMNCIPMHLGVLLNSKVARAKRLKTGDLVRIRSPFDEIEGVIRVTEEIHPQVIAISNGITTWKMHPIDKRPNTHFNKLLPAEYEWTDLLSGHMETATKVKISKVSD
ncbi:MAG: molybdopterin-dependent oxidoreductase [Peptococcaceae bacterium]|nr:molybdopterin-dependent oxidoreductase [Peptococcaceae bacterium]